MSMDDEIRELLTPPDDPAALRRAMEKARRAITQAQLDEYEEKLRTLSEHELLEELADATSEIEDQPHAAIAVGLITMEQSRRAKAQPFYQGSPRCTYCGKDEGDGIGPVVAGACPDCSRTWS